MKDTLLRAAQNNALWCDAVCSAQGAAGEFRETLWLNRFGTPLYYPDVVTLAPAEAAAEQIEAIAALTAASRASGWTVKDSFRCLDLGSLGFTVLFDAEWILRQPTSAAEPEGAVALPWGTVRSEADLRRWTRAWAGEPATAEAPRIFAAGLIARADTSFLFAPAEGAPLCGAILSKGAGVVGLSNVFHSGIDPALAWQGLLCEAAKRFPRLPVVGYEAGDELAMARRAGFRSAGPLRVWCKS